MNLIENAQLSIQVGVDDYLRAQGHDLNSIEAKKRTISAVRNIYAGILLMYKEKLRRLSPNESDEVLLKDKIKFERRGEEVIAVGTGRKTVDVNTIKERFSSLRIKINHEILDKINKVRNEIEHYSPKAGSGELIEMLKNSHQLIYDFVDEQLCENPAEWFDENQWEQILEIEEIIKREKKKIDKKIKTYKEISDRLKDEISESSCTSCGSPLLLPLSDDFSPSIECQKCKNTYTSEEIVRNNYGDDHLRISGGISPVVGVCPECSKEGLIDDDGDVYECIFCEETFPTRCEFCGDTITIEGIDYDNPVNCSYCNERFSKDD